MVKNVIEVVGALTEVINIDHGCVKAGTETALLLVFWAGALELANSI